MEATTPIQAERILHLRLKVVLLVGAQLIYCASLVENKIVVGVHGVITEVLEAIHTPPFSTPKEVIEASIKRQSICSRAPTSQQTTLAFR